METDSIDKQKEGNYMLNILLVDDSKSAQLKIFSIFSKYGKCDQAFNGREAIDLYKAALDASAPYDLIVMDVVMPQMDGFAAVKEIRNIQEKKNIPEDKRAKIIMLTSKADPDHMMKAHFELGVTKYVTKPFADKTLIEAMSNLGLIDG
jgi:two-component system chemotaxis response regulator CheY